MNLDRLGVVCHSNKCILELSLLGSKIVIKACFMKTYVKLPIPKKDMFFTSLSGLQC